MTTWTILYYVCEVYFRLDHICIEMKQGLFYQTRDPETRPKSKHIPDPKPGQTRIEPISSSFFSNFDYRFEIRKKKSWILKILSRFQRKKIFFRYKIRKEN